MTFTFAIAILCAGLLAGGSIILLAVAVMLCCNEGK